MFNSIIKNKPLRILIGINTVFIFGAFMFPPLFALFVKEIGGGVLEAGSIWAVFAIVTGILMLIISRFGDRIKEKEYLVAGGYLFRLAGWLGYFFATTLGHLYILQLVLAVGEAIGTPAFNAIYSEHLDKGKYIKQWGAWTSPALIIGGIAALFGGIIVSLFGFRLLFLLMASLAGISFFFLMIQPRKVL